MHGQLSTSRARQPVKPMGTAQRRAFMIVGLLLVVLAVAVIITRRPPEIVVIESENLVPGETWSAVVRLRGHDGDAVSWRCTDQDGTRVDARIVRGENGVCKVWIYPGVARPTDVFITARADRSDLATRFLVHIEPYTAKLEGQADPKVVAVAEGPELVIRGAASGSVPVLRLIRTDRGEFRSGPSSSRQTSDGGWEWRCRVPNLVHASEVEVELSFHGPVRHHLTISGLFLELGQPAPTVFNPRAQRIASDQGLVLTVPKQRTPGPREGVAMLTLIGEEPLTLTELPRLASPSPSSLGVSSFRINLLPEPIRVELQGSPGGGGVPSGRVAPLKPGPLPPLTVELFTPQAGEPLSPRSLVLPIVLPR